MNTGVQNEARVTRPVNTGSTDLYRLVQMEVPIHRRRPMDLRPVHNTRVQPIAREHDP